MASFSNVPNRSVELMIHKSGGNDSYHAKYMVFDRRTALIRSGDPHKTGDSKYHRYETAVRVDGDIAGDVASEFDRLWLKEVTNRQLNFQTAFKRHLDANMMLLSKKEYVIYRPNSDKYYSSTDSIEECEYISPMKRAFIDIVNGAKSHINIATSNFNDKDLAKSIVRACSRGVKINIIMGKYSNSKAEEKIGGDNVRTVNFMMNQINESQKNNIKVSWVLNDENMHPEDNFYFFHGKYFSCDGEVCIFGSSPLDKQAMISSRELDIVAHGRTVCQLLDEKLFHFAYKLYNTTLLDLQKNTSPVNWRDSFLKENTVPSSYNPGKIYGNDDL